MSYPAVREVIQKGKLPAARLGGKRYRVEIADVEAYEAATKVVGGMGVAV
jgi:excisionase family DNA binding protein